MTIYLYSKSDSKFLNLKSSVKTAGLKRQRTRHGIGSSDGDAEFQYESPVGTSPSGGVSDTVTIHNGEFVYNDCDLSFDSRVGEISICRTYRSQIQTLLDQQDPTEATEPFGSGWFFDAGMYLEVSHKHLRLWNSQGVYFDYLFDYAGKGQFIQIKRNDNIDEETSAYEITDRNRNQIHFNIDGTLRFLKDRFGNKFEYEYNEKAQLVKIKDCMQKNYWFCSLFIDCPAFIFLDIFNGTGAA